MPNPEGTPIWYELLTPDHDASKKFYDHVIGWTIGGKPDNSPMDYRMIQTADGSMVGGVMQLTDEMKSGGAKPTWLFYIGVDDVDVSFAKLKANGGGVLMEPFDIPGAGRAAFVTDPQGNPFYIMRGSSPESSTAYDRMGMGKCNWNELTTSDQGAGNKFYADTFGWNYPDKMEMPGDMGDYVFVAVGDTTIGATMKQSNGSPTGWRFYFRTPDIEDTARKVGEAGGTVMMGPHEVPGGDRIIVATDPHGTVFGAVGPGDA
ncbi:VOC family protein [Sphingomonas panacisoli]|uniref:VOC family protein n=1 Tax=Sphingomonas panacisoli TaxID=1813879 RepID=A0A5B8LJY7_9SPHN|nr:VOC family protein [Sphingomonas panacisoli]QDZ08316.1 VOC family protein [Sphingomonas panacisoli]